MLWCSNKIFPTPDDALECFSSLVSAVDDCKDVELTFGASSVTPGQATIEIKAVALGCGKRTVEDTTTLLVPIIIADVELLRGYGCDGLDNNQNGFDNNVALDRAIDECDEGRCHQLSTCNVGSYSLPLCSYILTEYLL